MSRVEEWGVWGNGGNGGIWWIWHHREGFRMPVLLHDVRLTGRLSHRRSRHWRQSLQTRLLTWFVAVVLVCFGVWLTYVPAKLAPRSAPPPLTRRLPRWGAPRPATRHEPLLPDGSARLRRRTGFSRPRFSAIQRCLAFLLVDALATASDAGKCATGVCPLGAWFYVAGSVASGSPRHTLSDAT